MIKIHTRYNHYIKSFFLFLLLVAILFLNTESSILAQQKDLKDELENLGLVYKDDKDEILQEFWLLGRYHGQYHWSEGSAAEDDGYETRRNRIGFQAKLYKDFLVHAQMVSGSDLSPYYDGFTELWGQYSFSPEISLTIGQQKNRFTHDRNVSSRYLNYLERAMLTNMFAVDYTPAVTLQGKVDNLSYYTGLFSNATSSQMEDSLFNYDSGYSYIGAAYYDLKNSFNTSSAYLYGSYIHSDSNQNATNMNRFDDGLSAALILTNGSTSLVTEATSGLSHQNGNATGLNLQPGYFLTDNVQVVGRYQLARSNLEQGLKPQRRYEREAGLTAGDLYHAGYLGVDYYIAKHRLKFMNGIEYATINGEDVWTASSMIRFYFGPHSGGAFPMNQMLPGHFEHD
jgi:phosphate-selective porin OprO/OprP